MASCLAFLNYPFSSRSAPTVSNHYRFRLPAHPLLPKVASLISSPSFLHNHLFFSLHAHIIATSFSGLSLRFSHFHCQSKNLFFCFLLCLALSLCSSIVAFAFRWHPTYFPGPSLPLMSPPCTAVLVSPWSCTPWSTCSLFCHTSLQISLPLSTLRVISAYNSPSSASIDQNNWVSSLFTLFAVSPSHEICVNFTSALCILATNH